KSKGKKALIPYIMAGDPSLEATERYVLELEEAGADIIELGIPFTDPMADGPTIQRAAERALAGGTTLRKVITFVQRLRKKTQIPVIAMTYYNPVFKYGSLAFIQAAVEAGIDGVIVPDLIPDEADAFIDGARKADLATIFLLAPTSNIERIEKVAAASTGFIYYVSITGITGQQLILDDTIQRSIASIRQFTDTPVAVGFGISTPEEAACVAPLSDGIIVGSAIVRRIANGESIKEFVVSLRKAV
ncbi:MAG TPA: tryptophan synthase subunit alpha, partial [Thermodesulfovibrionia bacterium]|nr:tryptophan synthase subunit alpha [Thermodesulfovibrionia bacterium]